MDRNIHHVLLLVDIIKTRTKVVMNPANINTVLLVYIFIILFGIGVILMVYTGRMDNRKPPKRK